jgi:hypothetical protein
MSARSGGFSPAIVEQDTLEDVANCCEMGIRYRQTERYLVPTFGLTDPVFQEQPLDTATIIAEVLRHEPRAQMLMEQEPDLIDSLIVHVHTEISLRSAPDA